MGLALVLLAGFWIGRFVGLLPAGGLDLVDLVVAALSAALLTVWYRRRARRYLESRGARTRARTRGATSVDEASSDHAAGDGAAGTT